LQTEYNKLHGITPQSTKRELQTIVDDLNEEVENNDEYGKAGAEWTVNGFANLDEFMKMGGSRKGTRLGKNGDDTNGNRSGRKSKSKQVYEDFEATKETQISDLAEQNYSKEDLEKLMQKAVNEMDFEKAAAIRDLLNLS
jgi:excinuclease UvrABC helicase subunit UvrB